MQNAQFSREGKHMPLEELKQEQRQGDINNGYLLNYIPAYPRPELHVSLVSHSTDLQGLQGIMRDKGFKDPRDNQEEPKVVWFSLTVSPYELRDAESRSVTVVHPGGREEEFTPQAVAQTRPEDTQEDPEGDLAAGVGGLSLTDEGILQKFATSPAFKSSSRYGSFRFTFSLGDVLDKYSQQFCERKKPVLRVYRTVLYKQEVMYVVLVHSPSDNQTFKKKYPRLKDTPCSICAFRAEPGPHFVWRPESMGDAHRSELKVINGKLSTQEALRDTYKGTKEPYYYVWDHVTLALHVGDEMLKFEDRELEDNLWFCEEGYPSLRKHIKKFNKSPFHVTE